MPTLQEKAVHIVGAGLAGSEAAWQLANRNIPVVLHEMRGVKPTEAHHTADCAELVCSNSFRSNDHEYNAVGLLHWEMQQLNSLIIKQGYTHAVPAGGALAVDREGFAQSVTQTLTNLPNVQIERGEVDALPLPENGLALIATGPLTSQPLAHAIQAETGQDALAFFDAIAPIVHKDSIDFSKAWFQSRYDKEGPAGDGRDYINCALEKDQYFAFVEALLAAEKTEFKEWEKNTPYFEGCMPIEIMAARGRNTLRFGPMKPVGLVNPNAPAEWADKPPYAVVQLRQDNALGTLYNMVGFQTKMKWGDQVRVFKTIPGLENAEFARLGGIHRNTFINSPTLLDSELRLKTKPHIRFAGQVTGCEGYVESAAVGLLSALFLAAEYKGQTLAPPPPTTALGALLAHITGGACAKTFQPMNINFGLFPPLDARLENGRKITGRDRKKMMSDRAKIDLVAWIKASRL